MADYSDQDFDEDILPIKLVSIQGQDKGLSTLHFLPKGMPPAVQGNCKVNVGNRMLL